MIKNVLIVDDDQEMLLSVKEGLEKYDESFSVIIAADGDIAVEKLKKQSISLVVSDLKMPRMNGFALLANIMEHYPDIPVIIITAYSTPQMEQQARKGGAVGYIEKPFMIEDLARKIVVALRQESEGGTLHGVSSGTFLQLIEMEQKTCTIRVLDRGSNSKGVLFFKDGDLLDARVNGKAGVDAAYEIFSWDEVNISIQNSCKKSEKTIDGDLQAILLEAMRRKDELQEEEGDEEIEAEPIEAIEEPEPHTPAPARKKPEADPLGTLKATLQSKLGERSGIDDIYKDKTWEGLFAAARKVGELLGAGPLRVSYLDRRAGADLVLLPGQDGPTVISLNQRCPKDRILQVLIDQEVTS